MRIRKAESGARDNIGGKRAGSEGAVTSDWTGRATAQTPATAESARAVRCRL